MSYEAGKVSHLQPIRGHLGDGVKYTVGRLGAFLPTFFSMRSGRTARQTGDPMQGSAFWVLVDTLPIWGILGANPPI